MAIPPFIPTEEAEPETTLTKNATGIDKAKKEQLKDNSSIESLSTDGIVRKTPEKLTSYKSDVGGQSDNLKKPAIIGKDQFSQETLSELSSIKDTMDKLGVDKLSQTAGKPSLPEKDGVRNGKGR